MAMKQNITLIGMPGSGKSTIGSKLAKEISYNFIDVDHLIEKVANMGLQEIINSYGEDKFLDIEEQVILNLRLTDYVISTGGSAVLSEKAMKHLKNISSFVFLNAPLKRIKNNLYNLNTRGIIGLTKKSIDEIYRIRQPIYQKYSDLTIDVLKKTNEDIINEILENLGV